MTKENLEPIFEEVQSILYPPKKDLIHRSFDLITNVPTYAGRLGEFMANFYEANWGKLFLIGMTAAVISVGGIFFRNIPLGLVGGGIAVSAGVVGLVTAVPWMNRELEELWNS